MAFSRQQIEQALLTAQTGSATSFENMKTSAAQSLSETRLGSLLGKAGVKFGATKQEPSRASVKFSGDIDDFRPRLMIPSQYLNTTLTAGPNMALQRYGGIVFPYTPNISQEYKANYSSVSPLHSNYNLNFFKNSSQSEISVGAKFTVQNDSDAEYYLSIVHLLRSLVKMQFGTDGNAGAPPPVLKFYAYGDQLYNNVPVVLTGFGIKLDEGVDYYSLTQFALRRNYGNNTVPTVSTFTISLLPVYSRNEMMRAGVSSWLSGDDVRRGLI